MKKTQFNEGWSFKRADEDTFHSVLIPHDAMIHEERSADAPSGGAGAYFPGGKYVYKKSFHASEDMIGKHVEIEFEGVYHHATVTVNGVKVVDHAYGYTPFIADISDVISVDAENTILVNVDNSLQPNSRWYTGSGIYRPVSLLIGGSTHIKHCGVRIKTLSLDPPVVSVETDYVGEADCVSVEILDNKANIIKKAEGKTVELTLPGAELWSAEHPFLYSCRVSLMQSGTCVDEVTESFGIRVLEYHAGGFFVNGKNTLLRGGCIHHDNGILGAATWDKAEQRRVRILKENGFNAIRMSHNPASDALIRACDQYGMYLIDEAFDMWYVRKNKYDYALDFQDNWRSDVEAMIARDYNHPAVIMYSIGNEVSEPGKPDGVAQGKEIIAFMKALDDSRPITGGMNLMIMTKYAAGKGQYDQVDQESSQDKKLKKMNGSSDEPKNASLAFNIMASVIGTNMNKSGNSKKADEITSPMLDALDICGYNYGSGRYPLEAKAHPNRIIMGSETFPQDLYKNWEAVKKYPYLIGDFMWTSWDYLGEAGLGAWGYNGGFPFNRPYPYILSGCGVIDILGNPDASCKKSRIVWEDVSAPGIGVRPVNHPGIKPSKSVWRGTNAIESWSWSGCDGNEAYVEVYSLQPYVELFLNGESLGRKRTKNGETVYKVKYTAGTVLAKAYDANGLLIGHISLKSAGKDLHLILRPEETSISAGDIVFIPVTLEDEAGIVESNADTGVSLSVDGGTLLGFGSADPKPTDRYDSAFFPTYYGRAMAVVYADRPGYIRITADSEHGSASCEIEVTAPADAVACQSCLCTTASPIRPAMVFGDHMTMQRDEETVVFGEATPGAELIARISDKDWEVRTTAAADGKWLLSLPPHEAAMGLELAISSEDATLILRDVRFGEVFLAGGQSNIEYFLRYDKEWETVKATKNDAITFFDYPEVSYDGQLFEEDYSRFGRWRGYAEEDLPYASAVGFYFANLLQQELSVPVGILGCNWGGSPACAWMDADGLRGTPGEIWLKEYEEALRQLDLDSYKENFKKDPQNNHNNPFDDSRQKKTEQQMFYPGMSRRKQKIITAVMRKMNINAGAQLGPWSEKRPGGLYETMLKKIAPYKIKGVIFYQGESDSSHPELYEFMLQHLIEVWRGLWRCELPFFMVQLAPFEEWLTETGKNYPALRAAQERVTKEVSKTYLCSSSDVGMQWDIHPKEKRPIGERLAKMALHHLYDLGPCSDPPSFRRAVLKEHELRLEFHHGNGLRLDGQTINAMELTDVDGKCLPFSNAYIEGDSLILTGTFPQRLKIDYAQTPYYKVNLYNAAGQPALPFQSEVTR